MEEEETTNTNTNLLTKKLQQLNSEASRVSRNIEKQISRSDPKTTTTLPDPSGEDGDAVWGDTDKEHGVEITEDSYKPTKLSRCFENFLRTGFFCVLIMFALSPIPMVAIGWVYFDDCIYSFYPTWLIVGGGAVVGLYVFICTGFFVCADGLIGGGSSISGADFLWKGSLILFMLDGVFLLVWYCVGCYYIWGGETVMAYTEDDVVHKYAESCRNLYYFVYTIIVLPLGSLGFVLISIVLFMLLLVSKCNS